MTSEARASAPGIGPLIAPERGVLHRYRYAGGRLIAPAVWLVAAMAVGASAGSLPLVPLIGAAGAIAILAWRVALRWSSPLIAVAFLLLSLGLLVPRSFQAFGEIALFGFVVSATLRALRTGDERWKIGAACVAVSATWLLLGLNPNVPSWSVALTGVRKTTLVFIGFAAGALWSEKTRLRGSQLLMFLMIVGAVISLAIHFLDPALEQSFSRQAGIYTALFQGKVRLQGIFAGPFHVALLGSFFVLRAWHQFIVGGPRKWRELLLLAALGAVLIALADVRTAYLTVGFGLAVTPLLVSRRSRSTGSVALLRTASIGIVLALLLGSGLGSNAALSSIPQITQTTRDVGRVSGWSQALHLFADSPLVGNGPGSAGATLSASFVGNRYVTADNEFLAVLVEGGLIGIIVIAVAARSALPSWRNALDPASPSAAAALALLGFCFTGNAFEAAPVSIFLAALCGLAVGSGTLR